jgi:hypothetical protein
MKKKDIKQKARGQQEGGERTVTPITTDVRALKGCIAHQGAPKTLQDMEDAIAATAGKMP